jgi:hypothetical protein
LDGLAGGYDSNGFFAASLFVDMGKNENHQATDLSHGPPAFFTHDNPVNNA